MFFNAYHFSYKILLLISAPICHPNFSQFVPCVRLLFQDHREIYKHSLQRENETISEEFRKQHKMLINFYAKQVEVKG
jgi:hypothetical protein